MGRDRRVRKSARSRNRGDLRWPGVSGRAEWKQELQLDSTAEYHDRARNQHLECYDDTHMEWWTHHSEYLINDGAVLHELHRQVLWQLLRRYGRELD